MSETNIKLHINDILRKQKKNYSEKNKECLVNKPGSLALLSVSEGSEGCHFRIIAYTLAFELRHEFPSLRRHIGQTLGPE